MKAFIKKVLVFFLLILIFTSVGIWLLNSIIRYKANFKIPEKTSYVVFGHSHPECAFNDSLISNFSNLSASGEAYFYTYLKAKNVLEQNDEIETVFIEFTNNQININKNKWIWSNRQLNYRYKKYAPFMSFKEHQLLFANNKVGFVKNLIKSSNINISRVLNNNLSYFNEMGGYRYLDKNKCDSVVVKSSELAKNEFVNRELPKINLSYLDKLINYCLDKNKNVYLIRSPMHHANSVLGNEEIFKNIKSTNFKKTEFLDFVNFPLKDTDFCDLDHLNNIGAKKFSIWFNNLLEKNILYMDNKQEFIDLQIKLIDSSL